MQIFCAKKFCFMCKVLIVIINYECKKLILQNYKYMYNQSKRSIFKFVRTKYYENQPFVLHNSFPNPRLYVR